MLARLRIRAPALSHAVTLWRGLPENHRIRISAIAIMWMQITIVSSLATWYRISGSQTSKLTFVIGVTISTGLISCYALKLANMIRKRLHDEQDRAECEAKLKT